MHVLTHLWVLPITGPDKDRGRTCFVCQYGSREVIAAFIRPDALQRDRYIKHAQDIYNTFPDYQAFAVILAVPEEGLKQELRDVAVALDLTIPLAFLDPVIGLPDTLPVSPEAECTILLYKGKQVEKLVEVLPNAPTKLLEYAGNALPQVQLLPEATAEREAEFAPGSSPLFQALERAARDMLGGH